MSPETNNTGMMIVVRIVRLDMVWILKFREFSAIDVRDFHAPFNLTYALKLGLRCV